MDEERGKRREEKKRKSKRESGLRGGKGRKLANWLAVVIQFKMDNGRGGVWAYRHADVWCVCTRARRWHPHASFPPVLYYFLLALVTLARTEGAMREEGEARSEKKKLASLHRESALIKAPFYTFRWHRGITSVSRYFFFFPLPHSIRPFFLPSFSLRAFCFAFFSLFFRLSPFFRPLFPLFSVGHAGYEIKGKRERRRRRRDPLSFETTLFALDCFERIRYSARIVG